MAEITSATGDHWSVVAGKGGDFAADIAQDGIYAPAAITQSVLLAGIGNNCALQAQHHTVGNVEDSRDAVLQW
jgi:hypothetical protein